MPEQWDAKQYLQFADQRLRPFTDLVDRVQVIGFSQTPPRRIVDLGCGPGNATALLNDRWPDAHVLGIDSSPAMLADAAPRAIPGRLEFEFGDLRTWQPEVERVGDAGDSGDSGDAGSARRASDAGNAGGASGTSGISDKDSDDTIASAASGPDLILSNAAFQWVPDHLSVITRLAGLLPKGGVLGFQVPGNFGAPAHVLLAELKQSARWRDRIPQGTERPESLEPEAYLDTLERAGLQPDVWETTYIYLVHGETGVTDFVRGSALRPVTTRLSPEDAAAFTADYQKLVREAYPPREVDGRVTQILPYRRIFAIGHRR